MFYNRLHQDNSTIWFDVWRHSNLMMFWLFTVFQCLNIFYSCQSMQCFYHSCGYMYNMGPTDCLQTRPTSPSCANTLIHLRRTLVHFRDPRGPSSSAIANNVFFHCFLLGDQHTKCHHCLSVSLH